jgi:hypothetical protein
MRSITVPLILGPQQRLGIDYDLHETMALNLTSDVGTKASKRLDALADHHLPQATQAVLKFVRDNLVTGNLTQLTEAMNELKHDQLPPQQLVAELDREFQAVNARTGVAMQPDGSITFFERNTAGQSLRFGADGKWAVTSSRDIDGKTSIGSEDLAPELAAQKLEHWFGKAFPLQPSYWDIRSVVRDQLDSVRFIMRHSMFAPPNCNSNLASERKFGS